MHVKALPLGNQRRKDSFHHEGTKSTKEDFSRKGVVR